MDLTEESGGPESRKNDITIRPGRIGRLIGFLRRHPAATLWFASLGLCLSWNYNTMLNHSRRWDQRYLYGWDENHYYAWARSWLQDGDCDFENDFGYVAHLRGMGGTSDAFKNLVEAHPATSTGRIPNKYGVGLAVLGTPLMAGAKLVVEGYERLTGRRVSKYASIYLVAFVFSLILVGFLGVAVGFLVLEEIYGSRTALAATVVGACGLPLIYYLWFSPAMSHAAGFGISTLLIAGTWWTYKEYPVTPDALIPSWRLLAKAFGLGLLCGLLVSVRYPDAILALGAGLAIALAWMQNRMPFPTIGSLLFTKLAAVAGAIVGILPQLLGWKALYGSWITFSYEGEGFSFSPAHIASVLFGNENSLLLWSPIAAICIAGLVIGSVRREPLCLAGLMMFVAFTVVYGSWHSTSLGASFGMRGFVDMSFFFLVGLAEFFAFVQRPLSLPPRRPLRIGARVLVGGALFWNLWMVGATLAEVQPMQKKFQGWELVRKSRRIVQQAKGELGKAIKIYERKYPLMTPFGSVQEGL